jgi:putative transposase
MKKSRFSESEIVAILKEVEAGLKVAEVCRSHGISQPTYSSWKSKYGGLEVAELRRIRELDAEHSKLKRMYADLAMENHALKEFIQKSSEASRAPRGGRLAHRAATDFRIQGLPSHGMQSIQLVS